MHLKHFLLVAGLLLPLPSRENPSSSGYVTIKVVDFYTSKRILNYRITLFCNPQEQPYHAFFRYEEFIFHPNREGVIHVPVSQFFKALNEKTCERDFVYIVLNQDYKYEFLKLPFTERNVILKVKGFK